MRAHGGCFTNGMGICSTTGSHLTSSHRKTHSRPVKPPEEGTKCFLATNGRYLWQHKKTKQNTTQQQPTKVLPKKKKKPEQSEPNINHQSSRRLTNKYLELSQPGLRHPWIWNRYCVFLLVPVDHCRDHRLGVAGIRELRQGWHWLVWGQSKGSFVTGVIRMPSGCGDVRAWVASLHKAWSAILSPLSFLCPVWELMGVQIFVLLLTFLEMGEELLSGGGKASYEVN